jgi:hypothetical protein
MTEREVALAIALGHCTYPPATPQKRFAREMSFVAKNDPSRVLSDRQSHYLEIMAWRYRRQMPRNLIPPSEPAPLPPAPKRPKTKPPASAAAVPEKELAL